mmetsp:Transcript_15962/g.21668  ORF Transcript_15962/g.21668 Transcript_15962/m.21668 type:complete len:148 (+) Transcript_15962:1401-1844(+)
MDSFQDVVRMQLFGGTDTEHFELVRDIETGVPTGVLTTSAGFNPFHGDVSARVLKTDLQSNYPIEIATYTVDRDVLGRQTQASDIKVKLKHKLPDLYSMRDLSPSSYAKLSKQVKESEQDAVDFRTNSSMMKNEESLSKCDAKCRKR